MRERRSDESAPSLSSPALCAREGIMRTCDGRHPFPRLRGKVGMGAGGCATAAFR